MRRRERTGAKAVGDRARSPVMSIRIYTRTADGEVIRERPRVIAEGLPLVLDCQRWPACRCPRCRA